MVTIFIDLKTRDGRRAVEIRSTIEVGNKEYYCSPKHTVYSCAYETPIGRLVAINRAMQFAKDLKVVAFRESEDTRAIWQ